MYANIVPPAGHTGTQLPRENLVTRRFAPPDNASASIRKHCVALCLCAAAACRIVQRNGSSGAGHFRCGAEFFSQTSRLLCKCAKMAAIVRPPRFVPGNSARQARGSRCASRIWFIASLTEYVSKRLVRSVIASMFRPSSTAVLDCVGITPPFVFGSGFL